jgi:thiamine transporter 2/3
MGWLPIELILCMYGALKEFRPSEPYLFNYQRESMNISSHDLNVEVYPVLTYSYLISLLPVLFLTDLLLYKPVLLIESASFIGDWLALIYGRSVFTQQLGEVLYAISLSTEIAYFAYGYVKFDSKRVAQ